MQKFAAIAAPLGTVHSGTSARIKLSVPQGASCGSGNLWMVAIATDKDKHKKGTNAQLTLRIRSAAQVIIPYLLDWPTVRATAKQNKHQENI